MEHEALNQRRPMAPQSASPAGSRPGAAVGDRAPGTRTGFRLLRIGSASAPSPLRPITTGAHRRRSSRRARFTSARSAPPTSRSVITRAIGTGCTGLGPGRADSRRRVRLCTLYSTLKFNRFRRFLDRTQTVIQSKKGADAVRTSDFDFTLPDELIAQHPVKPRDASRLMVVDRRTGAIAHRHFDELPELLDSRDLLVRNNSQVLPARLIGRRAATQGKWEGLFLDERPDGAWEILAKTRGRPVAGETVVVGDGLPLILEAREADGRWIVRPILQDEPDASHPGPAPSPRPPSPAPVHPRRRRRGGRRGRLSDRLRTPAGLGRGADGGPAFHRRRFRPARGAGRPDGRRHPARRRGDVPPDRGRDARRPRHARRMGRARRRDGRALRDQRARRRADRRGGHDLGPDARNGGGLGDDPAVSGRTDLFIRPGHAFHAVDVLLTNFHLPRSSLLVLVSSLAGLDLMRRAYAEAVRERYRFYSYGDAMLIIS